MIRRAIEGETIWLRGLTVSDIPYVLPNGINVKLRHDEVGLEIKGLVGAIPLNNGDTLQIVPKIGRVNFLRLLFKAEGDQRDLEQEYEKFVEYSIENDTNIDTIVARQLFFCVEEILRRSPKRGRIKRCHVGLYASGQIDPITTAFNIACKKDEPVVFYKKEKTEDIPENRVITEAVLRAWVMLNASLQFKFITIYERWLKLFSRSINLNVDLEIIENNFANGKYGGSRDYYRKALMFAQIILGNNGIGFNEVTITKGDAVLLNTANIFEKYVRNVISNSYNDRGYIITKGGIGNTSLYTDGSYNLQPDIVVSLNGKILFIADVKYKVPTSGDHYQINTYLNVNKVEFGFLISPLFNGEDIEIKEYITSNKIIIREVYLPMENLIVTEKFLGTMIKNYI